MPRRAFAPLFQYSPRRKEVGGHHQRNHSAVGKELPNAEEREQ